MSEQPQAQQVISQGKADFRENMPEWIKQLPVLRFPPPNPNFQLIDPAQLNASLQNADPEAVKRIQEDMAFLDQELLRLFRERDYEAKLHQNRYRLFQLGYIGLAATATLVGSLLAIAQDGARTLVPALGFVETLIALLTVYLATISGREPPLPLYLANRRRAEHLRREYFRYLMDLPPYDVLEGYERRRTLSTRTANINRGFFPETREAAEQ